MARILVAEDSRAQAVHIQLMLQKSGHTVQLAVDGDEALVAVLQDAPEVLLTDMHMPGLNGLELTQKVRESLPDVPVVLMTADGTEELAIEALRAGASNYIAKRFLARDLMSIIDSITSIQESRRTRHSILGALTHAESTYTFGNDRDFAASLVSQFESDLKNMVYDDETGLFRIVTALKEAILNAIDHGNLELDSNLREEGDGEKFYALAAERLKLEPYCHRKITVTSRVSPEQLAFIVRDEGPGFDPQTLPDPEDPENILRAHGRGLLLIRSFMDDVVFNDKGNQITLIKYREDPTLDMSDEPPILHRSRSFRILLAEDSKTTQVLAKSLLEREGHEVIVAETGRQAVELSADEVFDLILMDIEMPEMDGVTATTGIRQRESATGQHVPIIAMTAHDAEEQLERYKAAGMEGHLSKPVSAEKITPLLAEL